MSNPSDPETPRERAERVLREHTGVLDTSPTGRRVCIACNGSYSEHNVEWPCLPVLLARDVLGLLDKSVHV